MAYPKQGLVSYVDFKRVFKKSDDDLESHIAEGSSSNFEPIEPKMIPELIDRNRKFKIDEAIVLSGSMLQSFKVKINPVGTFEAIWTSQNTNSKTQTGIWAPSLDVTVLHSNKTRICLGHYANKGLGVPSGTSRIGSTRYFMVELTDDSKSRISGNQKTSRAVLAAVFPYPLRFKQAWHLARGDRFLYAWKAVAPEGFLALGTICSTTDEPPDVSCMRCVPAAWCIPSSVTPTKLWDDTGSGGGKPGSIWTVNSMDMMTIVAGHEPPKEIFYELKNNRFFVDQFARAENGILSFT
jgi:hypothetical protein